jgi:hypothetical protein
MQVASGFGRRLEAALDHDAFRMIGLETRNGRAGLPLFVMPAARQKVPWL